MTTIFMSLGAIGLTLTAILTAYYVCMYVLGINVLPTTMPIVTIERTPIVLTQQSIVDVSRVRYDAMFTSYMDNALAECGIERTTHATTWTKHETASYVAYTHN